MHRALEIEIEKERIRGEIIISEIARIRKLMMESGLALEMGSNGFPFSLSQQMDVKLQLDFSQLGTRVENMSLEERITNYLCREELQKLRNSEDVTIPDEGNESHEHNFRIIPRKDVPIPKSEVLRNAADLSELSSGVSMERADGKWSCALCHVTIPSERSLNEHLQGKKHRLKLQTEGIMKLNTSEGVKPTVEPILLGKTGEDLLMEDNLASFQGNLDFERLKENQCAFVQKVDCSFAPCEITSPDEQAPNEHLPRKKINMKKGMVNFEVAGRKSGVELSPKTATMLIIDTIDPCMEEEVDFMANHLLPMKTSRTRLKEHDLPPLQDNISAGVVYKENHSALNQKIEWSCALCHVVAPNERGLNMHLQGRKHKRKEATLISEGTCKNSGIKPSSGTSTFPAEESMDPSETLLLKETGEPSLKEEFLFQDNQNPDDLTKTQVAFGQKMKWSCPLCKVVVNNEQALNEHLQGKKHKLKGTGSKISKVTASEPTQVVQTSGQRMDKGVMCTSESLLHCKLGETCLEESNQPATLLEQDVPISDGGHESHEHNFQVNYSEDVPIPKSEVLLNAADISELSSVVSKERADGKWSCALCHVTIPNERSLNEHLQGKKHRLKLQTKGTMILNTSEGVKPTVEPILLGKTGEDCLMEENLASFQGNLDLERLKDNHCAFVQKVDCSCDPCEVTSPDEQAPNEHLPRKKINMKKGMVNFEVTGRKSGWGLSPKTAIMWIVDSSGVVYTENHSALNRKIEWSCALCHVVAPNERGLNMHLQGRKHKRKEATLISEGTCKNSGIKPSSGTSTFPAEESMDPSETLLLKETGEPSLKEEFLFQDNQNPDDLTKTQVAFGQKMKWSCPLCKVVVNNERALNEHLQGKKHKLKGTGSKISKVTASEPVQVVQTSGQRMDKGVMCTSEYLLHCKLGETCLEESNQPAPLLEQDVPISDGGHESHEHNFQGNYSEDVPIPKSEVLLNAADISELSSVVSKERADGKWSCALCHVTIPNERSLNEHLQGKKHRLKLQTKGTMILNTSEGVKPTVESILLGKTGEDCLMEENLASFQGNLDLERLKDNHCAFVQKVDCSCAPCEVTSPDEQAPNEHLPRKKINMKKGMVNFEVAGRKSGWGLSPKTATMWIVDSSGVVYTENHSALNQKIEWSCALCHVVAPNERGLNMHLQGRKHKRKEATLISEGTCKNSGIKPSSGTSTFPAEESMDPSETLLLKETGEPSLKEEFLFQDNQNPYDLTKTLVAFGQKMKWSCPLCKVVVNNERALNEHLQGKKHKLKGTGSKISKVTASEPVQVVQTSGQRMDKGVMCTSESLLHCKLGETCLEESNQPAPLLEQDVPISDGGHESHEHNFQVNYSEDVPIPKREVLLNAADISELSSVVLKERADGKWSCALCHVTIPNERSLNEHLQGKKHRLKLQTEVIMILNTSEGVKPTVEPILLGKTGEDCLMEENLASFQGNLDLERLKDNHCAFVQKVDCNCAPCEVTSPDEQAPNEHLPRKKINMKKGMVNFEVAGRKSGWGLSPKTATMWIVDSSGVVYTENHSALNQKIEWSCALCHVVAPNERGLNKHLQGRKHKRKEATLISEGTCKNSGIKPSSGTSTFPAEESMDPSETLLLKETGEPSLKEEFLFQDNQNPDDLTKTQVAFGQKMKWSCPLCKVVVNNERALNEHLQGKKHKQKGTGSKISKVTASEPVQVVQTSGQRMDKGVMCTSESLLHCKLGETCLEEWNQPAPLLEQDVPIPDEGHESHEHNFQIIPREDVPIPKSEVLRNAADLSELSSGVSMERADGKWSCSLCHVTIPNERSLNQHLQGKKHRLKLQTEVIMKLNTSEGVKYLI